jgi:hypothetical protein
MLQKPMRNDCVEKSKYFRTAQYERRHGLRYCVYGHEYKGLQKGDLLFVGINLP